MHDYRFEDRTIGHILADKAARIGDRTFLRWQSETITYAEADAATNRYARGFQEAGIEKGERVAVMHANCPEYLWVLWGLAKLGAISVPLNTAAKGDQLTYFLHQSGSTWLSVDQALLERFEKPLAECRDVRGVFWFPTPEEAARPSTVTGLPMYNLDQFGSLSAATVELDREIDTRDPHLIIYTSGSTGPPKGVVCPHSHVHGVASSWARYSGCQSDDVLYTCLPLFHGNALWYTVYTAIWAEATVALYRRFSARSFWREIRESNATTFNALGAMANIIWNGPEGPQDRDHKLRRCQLVPSTPELVEGFPRRFGVEITSVYALTETCSVAIYGPDDPPSKVGSAGRVRDYVDVQVVDERGFSVDPGAVGEIRIRPNQPGFMMDGYYNMPERTLEAMRDLWFSTGDYGSLDKDGYLYFSERAKEAIRRRGENVSAFELESVLRRHDAVFEAAAVAVPSDLSEDDILVYIVSSSEPRPRFEELVEFASENMAYYMVPRYWVFVDELPKTPSEKIEKYKLKLRAEQEFKSAWDRDRAGIVVARD